MSMFDFVKRSNQLMFGAAKESLKDYTRDISELGTAANQVRDKLSSTTRTARETMSGFKSHGIVSGISNWFYGKEFEMSCLKNPRNCGAWWAAVYGVTQSQTRLKQLSSSSSSMASTNPSL